MNTRLKQNIDQGWKFRRGQVAGAQKMDFDASQWTDVNLPHDWSIEGPVSEANTPQMGFYPKGIGWYRRDLMLDSSLSGRRICLEFEGVFTNSTLWVNGGQVGTHAFGYTGVVYDITPFVRCDGRPNVLAMQVDGREGDGWWYEGRGIYRHVWLIATDPLHVAKWGTFISTPRISESQATIRIQTTIQNDSHREQDCTLRTSVLDAQGNTVACLESEAAVLPKGKAAFSQETEITSPQLWSPDSPYLYNARTEVISNGKTVDAYETPFGVRWFEFTADRGFFLNGKHVQLRGWNIHNDFGGLGCALPDRANYKTIEAMKQAGCNFVRSAHHDASPSLMEACDRLGLLVWGETRYFCGDGKDVTKFPEAFPPLRDLIRRNRNHPSIICWGLANTAGGQDHELVFANHLRAMHEIAHEEDPTRPTAFACEGNADAIANGFGFVTDIAGYNGGGMRIHDRDHDRHPNRKCMISETWACCGARGVYQERRSPDSREGPANGLAQPAGGIYRCVGQYWSMYNACSQVEAEWLQQDGRPWLAGGSLWVGIDYLGESNGWPMPCGQFGVLDLCRFPKDSVYFFLQEWTSAPMVHIFPHWTWPGKEGQVIDVWGYTNCDSVELFLNENSLGIRERKPLGHMEWKAPYQPGTLRAAARRGGKIVTGQEYKTAGAPAVIKLCADRADILADGQDVSFVTVSIEDHNGVFVPTADNAIKIEIEGNGRILGLCSGDPGSHDNPKATNPMKAFNGLLLVIVQGDGRPGAISVKTSSNGLSSQSLVLHAR
jgi:beta-galactosidase